LFQGSRIDKLLLLTDYEKALLAKHKLLVKKEVQEFRDLFRQLNTDQGVSMQLPQVCPLIALDEDSRDRA